MNHGDANKSRQRINVANGLAGRVATLHVEFEGDGFFFPRYFNILFPGSQYGNNKNTYCFTRGASNSFSQILTLGMGLIGLVFDDIFDDGMNGLRFGCVFFCQSSPFDFHNTKITILGFHLDVFSGCEKHICKDKILQLLPNISLKTNCSNLQGLSFLGLELDFLLLTS